jgi:hypothetical protein
MNLAHVPIEMLYEQIVHPSFQKMVGGRFKIAHLKSEKGKLLNGKICTVVGYDKGEAARLHCRIIMEGSNGDGGENNKSKPPPVRVKFSNLVPLEANEALENFMSTSAPMSNEVLAPCLERSIQKHGYGSDRADLNHRIGLYQTLLEKIRAGGAMLQDTDYCLPCGAGSENLDGSDNFGRLMQLMKSGCFGHETCDLRFMDIGLKGDDRTECSVCQEVLLANSNSNDKSGVVLVTLPCLHIFHESCIKNWLGSDLGLQNWNCPFCRKTVPGDLSIYCVGYAEQLQRRFDEYPLSGYCTKCIIMMFETRRYETFPGLVEA